MVKNTESKTTENKKKSLSYAGKFGLDPDRKKIGMKTDDTAKPATQFPGENFQIVKIVMGMSRKKYPVENEDGEMVHTKIPVVQFDIIHEDGSTGKYYSPNAAIVEACENILKDEDFGADKETGVLATPCEVSHLVEGKGAKNGKYVAFG
jgi:hypothetical protein